ncbi:hypothetical protein RHS01_11356 [Rhizoctonia solani]|uniref:Uncharacterized protein n=1 Tax=Rhizoctonia solani TaxID=456999 RepID=A0A8H7LZP0_9AGAM|nr:hypothetical protein RHS01_11356 [Rhizoctonia solani]
MTTLFVTPTFTMPPPTGSVSYSLYQGSGINTATDLASSALPTQLIFDTRAGGPPVGIGTTGNAATMSVSPIFVGTADVAKSVITISASSIAPIQTARSYRRGLHRRAQSEEFGNAPPAGGVIRKLGPAFEKSASAADPFSDIHASEPPTDTDPFADPEKPTHGHTRTGSDSFLSMRPPRAPYTHQPSASTGSTESSRVRKREMEEARRKDMAALNNLVRALDQKERQAQAEGRDRRSLPPSSCSRPR